VRKLFFLTLISVFFGGTARGQMGPAPVDVAPVRSGDIAISRPLVATIEPVTVSAVASELAGRVASRHFDDGSSVEAGAVLVELDADLLRVDLQAAESRMVGAEAELNRACVVLDNAARNFDRQKQMFDKSVAPEKELLDATERRDVAAADIRVAEANVSLRRAEVKRIQTEIDKMRVVAPFSGLIAKRHVERGGWVEQGGVAADLVQLDPLYVAVSLPESLAPQIGVGSRAVVHVDALPGKSFEASVSQQLPIADEASRTTRLRLQVANPDRLLRPGFFARVTFQLVQPDVVAVPKDAVVTQNGQTHVVVARAGVAAIEPIVVRSFEGADALVAGNLSVGESVVVRGNEKLMPGAPLQLPGPPPGPPPGQ
jgi:membrane fusion protein, multidrug efflux system